MFIVVVCIAELILLVVVEFFVSGVNGKFVLLSLNFICFRDIFKIFVVIWVIIV